MSLLFTGRVVRASRNKTITTTTTTLPIAIKTLRPNSTQAAAPSLQEDAPSSTPLVRHVVRGYNARPHHTIDIHPGEIPSDLPDDSFETFLLDKKEPNKIINRGSESGVVISSKPYKLDSTSNISPSILKLLDRRLCNQPNHPINITKKLIQSVFSPPLYQAYDASNPVVSTTANFDLLGFPKDHPGRSTTDTYYINKNHVLRTHTSVHEHAAFKAMLNVAVPYGYTICADVFRRDSIDHSHFPVFHQMEGAKVWQLPKRDADGNHLSLYRRRLERLDLLARHTKELGRPPIQVDDPTPSFHPDRNPKQSSHDHQEVRLLATHLKSSLATLIARIFTEAHRARPSPSSDQPTTTTTPPLKLRWTEAHFPFTSPSWELEVFWQDRWLELLGCGISQQRVLDQAGLSDRIGWAWGLGVERLAMLLFDIPDIRLFWSTDPRFLGQFRDGEITRFEPFSRFPACYKDVAFWTTANPAGGGGDAISTPAASPPSVGVQRRRKGFHENDVMELVREVAGPLAEHVALVDEFVHPTSGRRSRCYRVNYRSLERTLTNAEVNEMHAELGRRLVAELGVELRL